MDVDINYEAAEKYGVQALPTFMIFWNGRILETYVGSNEDRLREMLSKYS